MLDYATAQKVYAGRVDKHVGRKVRSFMYMKYDQSRDCFVVSRLVSRHKKVLTNDPTYGMVNTWVKAPKEQWELKPVAEIHPTHVLILEDMNNGPMEDLFELRSFAATSNKTQGKVWMFRGQQLIGELPIMIKDGQISSLTPPKVRTVDNDKRNELNREIKRVRNLLRVRAKLGAFDSVTQRQLNEYAGQKIGLAIWQVARNPAMVLKLLNDVNPEKLESFYPLLWFIAGYKYYFSITNNHNNVDWVSRYNAVIASVRESLKRELGVVEYAKADE